MRLPRGCVAAPIIEGRQAGLRLSAEWQRAAFAPGSHVTAIPIAFGVVWVVFWLYWLASATTSKRGRNRYGAGMLVRLLIFVLVVVLLRADVLGARSALNSSLPMQAAGLALLVLGLGLAIWARVNLGSNWGTPMSEKLEPELVRSGPYRVIRHPIYSGLIVAMVGTALALGLAWVVVAAILAGYFVYAAWVEERLLARLFPDTFPAYRSATKMLIPFVF
jgi:protein-S-isoprenylcysteine O-methyltransferase Ste14